MRCSGSMETGRRGFTSGEGGETWAVRLVNGSIGVGIVKMLVD